MRVSIVFFYHELGLWLALDSIRIGLLVLGLAAVEFWACSLNLARSFDESNRGSNGYKKGCGIKGCLLLTGQHCGGDGETHSFHYAAL